MVQYFPDCRLGILDLNFEVDFTCIQSVIIFRIGSFVTGAIQSLTGEY